MSNATETKMATAGQIAFAAEKGIEGVTEQTERAEAGRLIGEWCQANPKPASQKQEERDAYLADLAVSNSKLFRRLISEPTEGQVKRLGQLYKGKVTARNMAHASVLISQAIAFYKGLAASKAQVAQVG